MTIVRDLRDRLHNMVYICLALIYFFISIEYIVECVRGYKDFGVVLGVILLHTVIYVSAYFSRRLKRVRVEYLIISFGYLLSYITCIVLDITGGAWLYIFPFGCVVLLFFEDLRVLITGLVCFCTVGIVSALIGWGTFDDIERIKVIQKCVSLIICSLMVLIVSYSLNYVFKGLRNWYNEVAYDKITGLRSIYYFNEVVKQRVDNSLNVRFSLGMIAVHEFYKYNERDYNLGNTILRAVAQNINKELSAVNIDDAEVCRQSGGRYFILLPNKGVVDSETVYKRIQSGLHKCVVKDNVAHENFMDTNIVITDTDICGHDYTLMQSKLEFMLQSVNIGDCVIDSIDYGVSDGNGSDIE